MLLFIRQVGSGLKPLMSNKPKAIQDGDRKPGNKQLKVNIEPFLKRHYVLTSTSKGTRANR